MLNTHFRPWKQRNMLIALIITPVVAKSSDAYVTEHSHVPFGTIPNNLRCLKPVIVVNISHDEQLGGLMGRGN